jgi:hypothetical protein
MGPFHPEVYGATLGPLLKAAPINALGPGSPNAAQRSALEKLTLEGAFSEKVVDPEMAKACFAGLWLMHDFFDESHTISQSIDTPSGSYWHGILHRREPDYSNAKYWFRQVGHHPVFDDLVLAAKELAAGVFDPANVDFDNFPRWNPFDFVDLCELAAPEPSDMRVYCCAVQLWECRWLFDYCYRAAIGK